MIGFVIAIHCDFGALREIRSSQQVSSRQKVTTCWRGWVDRGDSFESADDWKIAQHFEAEITMLEAECVAQTKIDDRHI